MALQGTDESLSSSVITDLRKGKHCPRVRRKIVVRETEEGEGGGAGAGIPLPPWSRPQQSKYILATFGKDHTRADIHSAAPGGPCATLGRYFLKETAANGEPTLEQVYPEGM